MNENDLKRVIDRVSKEINTEISAGARDFNVPDLHAQLKDFGSALDTAWSISYSTSSVASRNPGVDLSNAWEISYNTSSIASVENVAKRK